MTPRLMWGDSRKKKPRLPGSILVDGVFSLYIAVARAGVEPATFHFSGGRSYQLSYLARMRIVPASQ
jgi:hypothetical protein